jgi:hypothetical protein
MAGNEEKNDEKRRERAYRIWEEEGRPEGRHLDHWQRAEDQHEDTEREADTSVGSEGHPSRHDDREGK